jgi:hypothetical protein
METMVKYICMQNNEVYIDFNHKINYTFFEANNINYT